MVCEVVGFQNVEYDKKDGSGHVSGVNLFVATPIPADRGSGIAVEREYVKSDKWNSSYSVGTYDIQYGKTYTGQAYIDSIKQVKK